ncbi:hypothetical protein QOZ80_5BG0415870 [Eleusine coracana subsp. coracana]|nr:hypothetical protein QOZ80_5BG0415870 [Eleusine coracana subsp. coracana]
MQCPLKQAQNEVIYREILRPIFQHENGSYHCWIFGAIAELLDNVVDEIPHGATKVLIDVVPHPRDKRPSLLIQDGEGFKAGVSCLGANVIVFTRCVNTRISTQSIGLMSHVAEDDKYREHIRGPMVHYKYDPISGGTVRYEQHPGQFSINMSTLIQLSPYNSEEELLQNFNDLGPHGTKIIVFNLLRNNQGHLNLDFDTDKKDIRNNDATMLTRYEGLEDKNSLAYVSILYLGLPKYFKIVLRGEEVQLHNIAAELKHSQCMTSGHNTTGRRYKVVMGFLDGAKDDGMDRFCFYHKHRLILPFVPLHASLHKNRSIIGVLQADFLKLAKNKQDFMWSDEIHILQNNLKELRITFWKHLIVEQLASIEPSCLVSLTSFLSCYVTIPTPNIITRFHSQVNSSDLAHDMAPIVEPSYNDMPSYSIFGTPPMRATSDAAPSSSTLDVSQPALAKAHLVEPSTINGGASSSLQGHESHGGNNQREQGANLLLNLGRPIVTIKIEKN